MSSTSRYWVLSLISKSIGFSFVEEDLQPKLRSKIGDLAQGFDHYNNLISLRDKAKVTSKNRITIFVVLIIFGVINCLAGIVWFGYFIISIIFFAPATAAYFSYLKNKATAESKEKEASSRLSEIYNRIKMVAGEVYNELSVLHEAKVRPTIKHVTVDFASLIETARGKGIVLETIECPHCKGPLEISAIDVEYFECKYCGKTIHATKIYDKLKDLLSS